MRDRMRGDISGSAGEAPSTAALPAKGRSLGLAHYALLLLVCLFAFLPGISTLPPTDRDESRFVQSTRQMVESGDYIDIRLQDVPRYKKPIGIYWLQAAAVALSGKGDKAPIWVYRTISVLGATLAVLVAAWLGAAMFGTAAGLISGIALAGIVMLGFEARIAKTDAMLLATGMFAQAALARLYLGWKERRPPGIAPWIFWIAEGAAILVKGPVVPLVGALTVAALAIFDKDRGWLKTLKPLRGILLALLITAPWLVLITLKSGGAFWQESVGRDMLGKVGGGQESHGAPPLYYAAIYVLFFWPFGIAALDGGLKALNRFRADPRLLFCLAWYLPYWLVIELIPTKLPHYILPAYPALVLLMAWSLTDPAAGETALKRWQVWLRRLTLLGFVLVTLALAALAAGITPYVMKQFSWPGLAAALFVLLGGWLGATMRPSSSAMSTPTPNPSPQGGGEPPASASAPKLAGSLWRQIRASSPPPCGEGLGVGVRGEVLALASAQWRTLLATLSAAAGFALLTVFVLPGLTPIWLSPGIKAAFEAAKPCPRSRLVSVGYAEPSLVFLAGTDTLLTDAATAARTLAEDRCAVAVVEGGHVEAFTKALPGGEGSVEEAGTVRGINYSKGTERLFILFRDKE